MLFYIITSMLFFGTAFWSLVCTSIIQEVKASWAMSTINKWSIYFALAFVSNIFIGFWWLYIQWVLS